MIPGIRIGQGERNERERSGTFGKIEKEKCLDGREAVRECCAAMRERGWPVS